MNLFQPPPPTKFNFLSLGAGVQSSTMALMAAHGEITPTPDAAIFADTQAEPASVYRWLEWLTAEIQKCLNPFPVHVVTRGSLTDQTTKMRETKDGRKFSSTDIPFFTRSDGDAVIGRIAHRSCTADFKIKPILKQVRKLAGIKRGQTNVTVTQWIGMSWDELQRVKESRESWCQHRWPLCELKMRRHQCYEWMRAHGYPEPPRSACVYCPFHNNAEWRRLRDKEPDEFAKAVQFEKTLQELKHRTDNFHSVPFLHRDAVPLDQVDFSTDEQRGQAYFDFQSECSGMCGV